METRAIERTVEHRPWPMPRGPWILAQSWCDLLFAHWRVPYDMLRPLVPQPLEVEQFDGSAWIGMTPFRLVGMRPRFLPPVPGPSTFLEMNLRTYVRQDDRPGVFFFSLDAASTLAVLAARAFYRLPYFRARMDMRREAGSIVYRSERVDGDARFEASYRAVGAVAPAERGSLEYFLIERYALYAQHRPGRILRADIHHVPWPIQPAEAEIRENTVPAAHGIQLPDAAPLLHFSAQQDTLTWAARPVT